MNWMLAVVIATLVALAVVHFTPPKPQRHHIYYCVNPWNGMALPCKFRRNDPVSV